MKPTSFSISGNIVDVTAGRIYKGEIIVKDGLIEQLVEKSTVEDQFILPGLIDAHIHIESSMLVPSEFARLAVVQGTVATVSDPHEIANVLGIAGFAGNSRPLEIAPSGDAGLRADAHRGASVISLNDIMQDVFRTTFARRERGLAAPGGPRFVPRPPAVQWAFGE